MLSILNYEEIQAALLRLPGIIGEFERRDPAFASSANKWLAQAEQILISNRLPAAAGVASLRGILISAELGVVPAGLAFSGRPSPRRVKDAAAADVLRKAQELISGVIEADAARLAEGEKLMRQILAVAQRKGLLQAPADIRDKSEALNTVWGTIRIDSDLRAVATHIVGLVGIADVLILLDRLIPLH